MNNKILQEKEHLCKGAEWILEYNNFLDKVNKRKSELAKLQSEYDLQRQDILHYIEMKKCDAIISAKLMKKLKEISEQRRIVKEELQSLNSISDLSKKSKYKNELAYGMIGKNSCEIIELQNQNDKLGKLLLTNID